MDHKYRSTAVENLVESLSFEVEAVPQDHLSQHKSTSHLSPVNVKVRVRKKDKCSMQQGTICIPKVARNDNYPERIRLASSDQTIMSFNVLMEDSDYRKSKKKNIFGGCLHGATDDDDGPYMPKDEASGSKSGYKQKLALSKTAGNQLAPGDMQRKPKKFFGPCKPGGCLDPPFGEDRYSYLPPDTKKPSTDHEIDTKITDSHHLDNKIVEEIPIPPSSDNEIDTKTPKASTSDNEINERHPKASPSDSSTENKQSRCPKKENTCPAYDYKVDPATTPFSLSGFGSAARSSKESPDALDRNETNISSKQRKRKGSSDSTSTIKISKRISGINSSMLNVSKRRNELPLEDKESNSIITYAGDEDEVNNEKINKNRKSSISTNRTSFDLNAPYYLPPKRDSRDKDTNEKTEKLRRSLEPLGKAQNENYLDERDDIQKRVLRMGSDLQNEDTLSLGEHGQLNRKTDNNITNTKYIKRPSLQRSQDNEVDKPNPSVKFPPNNTGKEFNEGAVVFLDSPDYFDKTKTINYKKDQVNTSESISKKFDETTQKYKTNEIFAVEKENVKDSNANTKEYNGLTQLNSYGFDIKTGKEESLDTHPENDIADISYQDVKSLKDVDIKRAESSNKIDKLEPQSEKHNDYLEFDTTNAIDETKKLQVSSKDHQVSEYFEGTPESKSWPANKEAKRYSLENLDSKDIVTLKSGAFYKEISDAESDYKVTDSRSSFMYKKYEDNYNTAANITTDKDLSSMFRTSITKVDRNSKDKLYEHKVTASNLHCIDNGSSKSSDGDDYKLENIHSINQDTETRKYKEGLLEIGKVLDIDNGSQNYNEISENNDNSLNTNLKYQIYDNMAAKRDSYLNIDNRNKNYDEISSKGGSNSNIDNRTRQHDELLAKRDSSLNTDIRIRKFHEKSSTKTGSRDSIDIRSQKYDELSANRGSSANMNIKPQKYEAMLTKEASDSNMNIMTLKYEEVAAKTEASSNKFARDISLDLAFQNSFDGSVRVLKTIETPLDSKIQVDPNIFLVQKRITHDGEKTQVLIDSDTNMTIQLNRNSVDSGQEKDHNIHKGILISDEHETHSQHQNTHPHVTFSSVNLHENLSYLYENELIPLQNMIKNLKAEIDALAGQHRRRERVRHQRLRPVARCSGIVLKK